MGYPRAMWSAALALAVVIVTPLDAQKLADPAMPLPPGAVREKGIEEQAAAGKGPDTQLLMVYRSSAPVEMLVQRYKRKFTTAEDIALDTAALQPGGVTPISYHITPHVFVDECVDPPASVATANAKQSAWSGT